MRKAFVCVLLLTGCTSGPIPLFIPIILPSAVPSQSAEDPTQAAVERIVKGGFPAILSDIQSGGGPILSEAFDAAGVPQSDRATRVIQLNNDLPLYAESPGALVTAILLYGA